MKPGQLPSIARGENLVLFNRMKSPEGQAAMQVSSRFGLNRGASKRLNTPAPSEQDAGNTDFTEKLLHLAWHPEANLIAAAASNSLYMFCAK